MAASFKIHVRNNLAMKYLYCLWNEPGYKCPFQDEYQICDCIYEIEMVTPSIYIGDVSWLKAALLYDDDKYVPDPIGKISDAIGVHTLVELTHELKDEIMDALDIPNNSDYELECDKDKISEFLNRYVGSEIFTISW